MLIAKLQAELAKNEIHAARDARFSKLKEEQYAINQVQVPFQAIFSRLAELLNDKF